MGGGGNAKVIIFRIDTRFIKKKFKKRNMGKNSPTMNQNIFDLITLYDLQILWFHYTC